MKECAEISVARIIMPMTGPGTLYLVPTPIGNLGDITLRAVDALRSADAVLCEDTRVTGKLLAHLDLHKPLERLDENVMRKRAQSVIARLQAGETLAYCSDAGMPGVSDPGMHLVACAREADVPVVVLPGASAAITAYVASGFSAPRFLFAGFMPRKTEMRATCLEELQTVDAALIFYESPHRLCDTLTALAKVFPHRRVAVCRELTKLHEELVVDTAPDLAQCFSQRQEIAPLKGEIVIVVDAPSKAEKQREQEDSLTQARDCIHHLLQEGVSPKEAARSARERFGITRNEAYEMALTAKAEAVDGARSE